MASATLDVGSPLDDYFRLQGGEDPISTEHSRMEENDPLDAGDMVCTGFTS